MKYKIEEAVDFDIAGISLVEGCDKVKILIRVGFQERQVAVFTGNNLRIRPSELKHFGIIVVDEEQLADYSKEEPKLTNDPIVEKES